MMTLFSEERRAGSRPKPPKPLTSHHITSHLGLPVAPLPPHGALEGMDEAYGPALDPTGHTDGAVGSDGLCGRGAQRVSEGSEERGGGGGAYSSNEPQDAGATTGRGLREVLSASSAKGGGGGVRSPISYNDEDHGERRKRD